MVVRDVVIFDTEGLTTSMKELSLAPQDVVIVSGIGQAAKTPQYLNVHISMGCMARSLPPATAIKPVIQN